MRTREIRLTEQSQKELKSLGRKVELRLVKLFRVFAGGTRFPDQKFCKMSGLDFYEFRLRHKGNTYRAIGKFINSDLIILVIFQKKTQKTPLRIINLAKIRLRNYRENNEQNKEESKR